MGKLQARAVFIVTLGIASISNAYAINWLMAQGTEKPKAPDHRMFGFVQPQYSHNTASDLSGLTGGNARNNGDVTAANKVGPALDNESEFHFKRARVGWRGKLGDKINYFTLFEIANNALTYRPFGDRKTFLSPSDLSLTFNYIDGARIRIGLFKNPGSEESFQGIGAFDYIEFTDWQNRVNLERFAKGGRAPAESPTAPGMGTPVLEGYGFSAFRDWGIQVFDSFKSEKWDLSYAVKVGRGEYLYDTRDPDFHPEIYTYLSAEYDLPGGKKARKHGVKLYAWRQQGERSFESDLTNTKFDRIRQGLGFRALGQFLDVGVRQRLSAEYMLADGMIFTAPRGNVKNGTNNFLQYAPEKGNKARGYYIDVGIFPTKKWELGFRYDHNDLLYETNNIGAGNERDIDGYTFAVTHYFKPNLKLAFNYIKRKANHPVAYAAAGINANVEKITGNLDDKYAVQLSWFF